MSHEPPYDAETYVPLSGRTLVHHCAPKPGGLVYSPDVLYFHFVGLDQVSDWQPFVISNTADVNIGVGNLAIDSLEFELQGAVPTMLQPGESVTLNIRFRPAGEGARLGSITVQAGEEDPQPKVRLIGIGGSLTSQVQGDPTQVQTIVNTFLGNRWAYRYGTFAVDDVLANELIMDYHVTAAHVLQPNFAGCGISVSIPPGAEYILTVLKNDVPIGTITFNPDGTIERMTNGGLAVAVPVNAIMTVKAAVAEDAAIGRIRVTFVGVVPLS